MTDIFNADQPLFPGDDVDPNTNYLEVLVGEGKKFKTPEELARGKAEADALIARLIAEKRELETEVTSRKALQELVDQLRSTTTPSPSREETTPLKVDEDQKPPQTPDVRKLLDEALTEREKEATRRQNLASVQRTLEEKLGPGYAAIIKQQAPALGMTTEEMTQLASERPKAFLRLVGVEDAPAKGPDLFTPPPSSQNSQFKPQGNQRNYAYWQKLRRENSQEYWKRQGEMHQDAMKLGPDFYK